MQYRANMIFSLPEIKYFLEYQNLSTRRNAEMALYLVLWNTLYLAASLQDAIWPFLNQQTQRKNINLRVLTGVPPGTAAFLDEDYWANRYFSGLAYLSVQWEIFHDLFLAFLLVLS